MRRKPAPCLSACIRVPFFHPVWNQLCQQQRQQRQPGEELKALGDVLEAALAGDAARGTAYSAQRGSQNTHEDGEDGDQQALLDGLGYEAAIDPANALVFNNDLGLGRCSHLEGLLPAGDHYFVVDNGDEPATYAVRVYPLRGVGDRCDVWGVEDRCAAGTTCVDANGDGDGVCQ